MRDLRARHSAAVSRAVLVDERRRLAKVSGSQGCQVARGEDVRPRRGPGFKGDVAGVAAAGQGLLWHWLASHWGSWRFGDRQLNGFGQDGTIGFESVVLQVASWAHVDLPTWQGRLKSRRVGWMDRDREGRRLMFCWDGNFVTGLTLSGNNQV